MEFNFKCKYKIIIRFSRRIWLFDIVVFFVFLTKNNINIFNSNHSATMSTDYQEFTNVILLQKGSK